MALTKVLDGGTNFTGATSAMVAISRSTSTSTVTSIDFDNLSTDFDTFYVTYFFKPATDGHGVRFRFLDSSGTAISSSNAYQYYYDAEGATTNSNGNTLLHISGGVGNANYEGHSGYFYIQNRNYVADSTNKRAPSIMGGYTHVNTSGNGNHGFHSGHLTPTGQQAIRGFSVFDSGAAGVGHHDMMLYGVRLPS